MMKNICINTDRFILRSLVVGDASEKYCAWFHDPDTKLYIESAKNENNLKKLQEYIQTCQNEEDIVFLGIFTKEGDHLGNIKYEPVNIENAYAVMGILIGEVEWRGKGVAAEVILDSARWLKQQYGIKKIYLGVRRSNAAAVTAYKKIGFAEQGTPELIQTSGDGIEMVLFL